MKVETRKEAIDYLGAIRLSSGSYAYLADEVGKWYVVTPGELDKLVVALQQDPRDGYSLWCTYTGREATPEEARLAEELLRG